MNKVLRTYRRKFNDAVIFPDCIITTIRSMPHRPVVGIPPDTPEFRKSANDLGYGDDIYWHLIEHDLLHSLVAELLWDKPSYSLTAQAKDSNAYLKTITGPAKMEEEIVGEVQAALNGIAWGRERLVNRGIEEYSLIIVAKLNLRPKGVAMTSEWANA